MTETPGDHVAAAARTALAEIADITDPVDRELAARQLLDVVLPEIARGAREIRQGAVLELRRDRFTLREIGEKLGGLSTARVDQIAKGK
ncbi:hypothetical protein ACWCXH_33875 [Kitasatospora sp. NPDC001660]